MSRLANSLPLSAAVFVVWLLLVGRIDFGSVLMALILALLLPLFTDRLRPQRAHMQRPLVAMRLAAVVLWDIVHSNINVARLILGRESKLKPAFVWIPLDLRNPHGIATLAGIITMTPGTVSVDLSPDQRHLLVHFLDVDDHAAAAAQIKQRYEAPLIEVFP
jgi:multicomponent K+:H+ antiporter subunit E